MQEQTGEFSIGDTVEFHGLDDEELNGLIAIVTSEAVLEDGKEKYDAKVQEGSQISNLSPETQRKCGGSNFASKLDSTNIKLVTRQQSEDVKSGTYDLKDKQIQ